MKEPTNRQLCYSCMYLSNTSCSSKKRNFVDGAEDRSSIPGRVEPKNHKDKVEQSWELSAALPY